MSATAAAAAPELPFAAPPAPAPGPSPSPSTTESPDPSTTEPATTEPDSSGPDYIKSRDALVALIEQGGELPWRRPWRTIGTDAPESVHGHKYRGANRLLLGLAAQVLGYTDHRWITFRQAKQQGGSVMRGETSLPAILWRPVREQVTDGGEAGVDIRGAYLVTRCYRVFNVQQTEGTDIPPLPAPELPEPFDPIERCERVMAQMPDRPELRHEGNRAYYDPHADRVTLPAREQFESAARYYGTAWHELAHATGHARRLDRGLSAERLPSFGSADYSREELVAECASAFVCGAVGIDTPDTQRDAAAYLKNWLAVLKSDARAIVTAAQAASKAADYILNTTPTRES